MVKTALYGKKKTKRIGLLGFIMVLWMAFPICEATAQQDRPNIIWLMAEETAAGFPYRS